MPATIEAPRSAAEAADELALQGKHVHLVSPEGDNRCLRYLCGIPAIELPSAVREQARLARLSLSVGIQQL